MEISKDFYVTLNFFDNFDSRPPVPADSVEVTKNDYGVDFSLTWKFD